MGFWYDKYCAMYRDISYTPARSIALYFSDFSRI